MGFRQTQSIIFAMTLVSIAMRVESTHSQVQPKRSKKESVEGIMAPKSLKKKRIVIDTTEHLQIDDYVEFRPKLSKRTSVEGTMAPKSMKKHIIDTTNQDLFDEFLFSMPTMSNSDVLEEVNGNESKMSKKTAKGISSNKLRTGKSGSRDKQPSPRPTPIPTRSPTTPAPSKSQSHTPTVEPPPEPTREPTLLPSRLPINRPSNSQTELPTIVPTLADSSFPFTNVPTSSLTEEATSPFTDEPTTLPTPSATALFPLPTGDDDDDSFIEQNNTDSNFDDGIDNGGGNRTDDDVSVPDTSVGGDNDTNVTPFIAGVVGLFVIILGSLAVFRKKKRSGASRPPQATD